jgi:hypothetical protein
MSTGQTLATALDAFGRLVSDWHMIPYRRMMHNGEPVPFGVICHNNFNLISFSHFFTARLGSFISDGTHITTFRHYATKDVSGKIVYHQWPVTDTNIRLGHQSFKTGRRQVSNLQDWTRKKLTCSAGVTGPPHAFTNLKQ